MLAASCWLQWGHGDEAVEEVSRRMASLPGLKLLQWGHGDEAVEEIDAIRLISRPVARFNGATAMKPWKRRTIPRRHTSVASFNGATAMKPWKRAELGVRRKHTMLQWGHGDEAVEEQGGGPQSHTHRRSLQWGHGDEAVEEGPPPGPFGAEDLGPGLREGRTEGVSNRSRDRVLKS